MATPLFDDCSVRFSRKIGDAVASASTAGNILSANERTEYINQAANELFRKYWEAVAGNIERFIEIFPELHKTASVTTDIHGIVSLSASGTYDFFKIIDGHSSQYIRFLDKALWLTVYGSENSLYVPSTDRFYGFELSGSLRFLPAASFNAQAVTIAYIKRPVDPTNGNALTQGGTYDLPFYSIWNEEIAEIAYQIWRTNQQEGR